MKFTSSDVCPVKPFVALFARSCETIDSTLAKLEHLLGPCDLKSDPYDVGSFTKYYEEEMGVNLKKRFFSFLALTGATDLVNLKVIASIIEADSRASNGTRIVNIDPGYLSNTKVVLSSHKDSSNRIYLGNYVYAEVTLVFKNGSFEPLPCTYPDYKSSIALSFFNTVRTIYQAQIKNDKFEIKPIKGL